MLNDARTHLEIRATTDSVWKSRLIPVLAIVLFITTIAGYFLGKRMAQAEWQGAVNSFDAIEVEYSELVRMNAQLVQSLAFEKAKNTTDSQIMRQAYDEIVNNLAATSKEVADLKENIRFYERIIDDTEDRQGLQIDSFSLLQSTIAGQYKYKVIIVNSDYGKKSSPGNMSIELEGLQEGELKTIKIAVGDEGQATPLLFKYFQRVDGVLEVPDNFQPQRVHVKAHLSGKKAVKTEKWYNWKLLIKQSKPKNG